MPRKPTGEIGTTKISNSGADFEKIPFPTDKESIEVMISNMFVEHFPKEEKAFFNPYNPTKNAENDFDFTISTDTGSKQLELMEYAPIEQLHGKYQLAPNEYLAGDFADDFFNRIMKKSVRYAGQKNIILLTYFTHWAFIPSDSVIGLLQWMLITSKHSFERVFLVMPFDRTFGLTKMIYPAPLSCHPYSDAKRFRNNKVINLDPTAWQTSSETSQ